MKYEIDLKFFLEYIKDEQKKSKNTIDAYQRDLECFIEFISARGVNSLMDVTNTDIVAFMMDMRSQGRSKATINRRLSSLRAFYRFAVKNGFIKSNPTDDLKSPKLERKELDYLTIEEVTKVLELPDSSPKGLRDKAILEVLYATGIRVSEMIELNLEDANITMGFITCDGEHGKARIVPLGRHARKALKQYLQEGRKKFFKGEENLEADSPLFVNYRGERFTRQGFWKLLKNYGKEADLEDRISPHILRNSFAVHMLQNGADVKTLQELMGHEDMQAMQIYLSVTKNRIKDVYNKTHPRA